MNKGILVLAGASAVGKTTVASRILEKNEKYRYVRSATTRKPRGDSFDGEYVYLDSTDFQAKIASGEILEYTEYGGNFYGTPISEIEDIFGEGKIPLLVLDLNGVRSLRSRELPFSVNTVYIYEDINVVEKRLYDREIGKAPTIEGLESFEKRKSANRRDYALLAEIHSVFDAFVKNSDVDACASQIVRLHTAFLNGEKPSFTENEKIAKSLAESVK